MAPLSRFQVTNLQHWTVNTKFAGKSLISFPGLQIVLYINVNVII